MNEGMLNSNLIVVLTVFQSGKLIKAIYSRMIDEEKFLNNVKKKFN